MKQFKKWQNKREVKTIGYLNNSSAYKAGEEEGWRAALEWAIKIIWEEANKQNSVFMRVSPLVAPLENEVEE